MIGRAEAQVTRLSALYSVLDRSALIRPEHQAAAVAVWEYCEASARYIFGEKLGDPVADEILGALRHTPDGLTRTEIRNLFSRHKSKAEVGRALDVLVQQRLASCRPMVDTGGRPRRAAFSRVTVVMGVLSAERRRLPFQSRYFVWVYCSLRGRLEGGKAPGRTRLCWNWRVSVSDRCHLHQRLGTGKKGGPG
jgi:hypothetical protein